ncbi:MAG: nucleotidyltransferase substrate binding protein [Deltaproteobacteria bacterium]|nr:nucleotidyltransferase substrate binding protein [Deltaproteobacteria bacterium]
MKDIRWEQRLHNLEKAFSELTNACKLSKYSKLERSGLIQTFEFTFELIWKTLQDLLINRGYQGPMGPRPVIEQAFHDGLIHNAQVWHKMLLSRNMTVHSYDEKTAEEIAFLIKTEYEPVFKDAVERLCKEKMSAHD